MQIIIYAVYVKILKIMKNGLIRFGTLYLFWINESLLSPPNNNCLLPSNEHFSSSKPGAKNKPDYLQDSKDIVNLAK